jgi:hypothetical protein
VLQRGAPAALHVVLAELSVPWVPVETASIASPAMLHDLAGLSALVPVEKIPIAAR